MASRTVGLYKYVPTESGWKYLKAAFHNNNRIKPHVVLTADGEKTIRTGNYYLYHSRKWETVGDDPSEVYRLLLKKRGELLTVANGGTVLQTDPTSSASGTLRARLDEWLEEVKDGDFHEDTYDAKRLVADEFMKSCKGVKLLSAVTRKHCLTYINAFLKKQGNDDRTRFNKFLHLRQFLNRNKLTEHLTKKDAPKYSTKDPVAFEDDELAQFWEVCQPYKHLMYTLLLCCGLRLQEIQTLVWTDILWKEGLIRIRPRPEWGFFPKKEHCRDIPLGNEWLERLRQKKLTSKSPLVFTTKSGKPVKHLWDDCQTLFAKTSVPKEKWHPHTFRATFCTTLLRQNVPVPDVMRLMGHRDVKSTMRYMVILEKSKLREMVASVKFAVAS